ncbi:hypothetical protein DFJ77DRAFT_99113 [Powellomyces hirtus]|nr:hypothetical protein DFJ77DRAFT_99113 [Powellomyces hirtus]
MILRRISKLRDIPYRLIPILGALLLLLRENSYSLLRRSRILMMKSVVSVIQKAGRRCSEVTRRYNHSERVVREAEDQIHILEGKIDELESELMEKRRECAEASVKETSLLSQMEALEVSVMTLKKQLTTSKSNSSHLRQQLDQLTAANKKLTETLQWKETELTTSETNLHHCERDLRKTLELKGRLEGDIKKLSQEVEIADERMKELQVENNDLKDTIETLKNNLEEAAMKSSQREHQILKANSGGTKVLQQELEMKSTAFSAESSFEEGLHRAFNEDKHSLLSLTEGESTASSLRSTTNQNPNTTVSKHISHEVAKTLHSV